MKNRYKLIVSLPQSKSAVSPAPSSEGAFSHMLRSIDILGGKEYNYTYQEDKLIRSAEYDITVNSDGIVTSKTTVNNIKYYYDDDGNLTKKIITRGEDEQFFYYEDNEDNSNILKFTVGGRTLTSHSKTDSFGRKVFDELQVGTGFVSRQFHYHAGEVTTEHKNNDMLKSSPTTQLVSRIVLSSGRTLEYKYDEEERITKVIDSVGCTTEYTYDALGQLLTETVDGTVKNAMTYDNYGNILTKNDVSYTYDTVWKDKLTGVGDKTITYDAQGNPTSYLGHTLTWEKGRQLKSIDNDTFTYNANGIRTGKYVSAEDGVHKYILDGTKIIREEWTAYGGQISYYIIPIYDNEDNVTGINYCGSNYYFLKNLQGDVIEIVSEYTGETLAKYSYDAWGKCTIDSSTIDGVIAYRNPYRYRSYYYDQETDLYYLQSRYYDANTGRFINGDVVEFAITLFEYDNNLYTYCNNSPIDDVDFDGFKSYKTKNKNINKIISKIEKYIPNIYSSDFKSKEKTIFKIGTKNLSLTFSVGASVQSNKNALFGAMFSKGTLEVSSYLGINNYVCFGFSAGINWRKAYLKTGIFIALSKGPSGLCIGFCLQINIPTWLLAVATVAVVVVSIYAPAIAGYIVKTLATIRSSIRVATPVLVPLVTNFALKLA